VYWLRSNGEVMTVHQPELLAASRVRKEVTTIPAVGITHSRQSATMTSLAAGLARPRRAVTWSRHPSAAR
jgi:hypothetical protein